MIERITEIEGLGRKSRIFLTECLCVDTNKPADPSIEARLKSGQLGGESLDVVNQSEQGVTVVGQDGKRAFLSQEQLALIAYRNRGRG